jgi:methylenetetrahydrofolate dehydrogenase (NADP+)/methenyltetrahydrofolate cyclohydrolase
LQILNGKEVAAEVRASLLPRITEISKKIGRPPHLAVVIVGQDPASHVYVKNKKIACEKLGMTSTIHTFPVATDQKQLNQIIDDLNKDSKVDAILVQFPLPTHLSAHEVLQRILPEKDADGLTYNSLGFFFAGRPLVTPCTPAGVMEILKYYKIDVSGKSVVVVGRSNIVGKPMAQMLMNANATVTICHSKTQGLRDYTRRADIVVVAAGKARLLGKDDFKENAIVIDVGMHGSGSGSKLCGDVRFEELVDHVQAASPVPGGVGPMTIAMLLSNTCYLAERRAGI